MQALVIRISRDVYVLDNTVNFMLNKRKSKKAAGSYQRSPKTPLLSREGARPSRTLPQFWIYIIQTPPFPKSWIRPWGYIVPNQYSNPLKSSLSPHSNGTEREEVPQKWILNFSTVS